MNIKKQASLIAFVKAHAAYHIRGEQPIVYLFTIVFHTVEAQVPYLNGFFFGSEININVTRHQDFRWLQNEKLKKLNTSFLQIVPILHCCECYILLVRLTTKLSTITQGAFSLNSYFAPKRTVVSWIEKAIVMCKLLLFSLWIFHCFICSY